MEATFDPAFNVCNFETTDGISWAVQSAFDASTEQILVVVDVNGAGKDPNFPVLDIILLTSHNEREVLNLKK